MDPLDIVGLPQLMDRSSGIQEIVISLIDGPVSPNHPDLVGPQIRPVSRRPEATCTLASAWRVGMARTWQAS
jgi:hypothetical protein